MLPLNRVNIDATEVLNHLLHPSGVPAIGQHLVLQLLSRHIVAPEAIGGLLRVGSPRREEEVAIGGQGFDQRSIHLATNDRNIGKSLLAEVGNGPLRPLLRHALEGGHDHIEQSLVIGAINDGLCHIGSHLGNGIEAYVLQETPILPLPAHVGDENATLKHHVGTKLHLLLEAVDVTRRYHPLHEATNHLRPGNVGTLHREGTDVRLSQSGHT